jgi:hypothetical protein
MKDKTCLDLADRIEAGEFDNIKFKNLLPEQIENIIASLIFSSERVGIEVVI